MSTTQPISPDDSNAAFNAAMQGRIRELDAESVDRRLSHSLLLEKTVIDGFKVLREERGWSQLDLSGKLKDWGFDLHQTTIAKLEAGKRPLRVAEMFALAYVFGLPPAAAFYMAKSTREIDGMDQLTEELAAIDEAIEEQRRLAMSSLELYADVSSDYQLERKEAIRLMRESANNGEHQEAP